MTDIQIDRPPTAKRAVSASKPATVSASKLAAHLDCSRVYVRTLEQNGVLHRDDSGDFPLDESRIAYLRYLRRERRQSPRGEADADFTKAKAELIRLRIAEKQRTLIPVDQAMADQDTLVGLFLSGLAGFAARCGGRDLTTRRAIDLAVRDLRREIAETANRLADERGEPAWDADAHG